MEMVVKKEKKEIRQKLLEKLLALTAEELKRRSTNVEKMLSNLPIYKDAKVIMAYYPLKGEVDILSTVRKVLGKKRICFPVMDLEKKTLSVFEVENFTGDFALGPYGVLQPDPAKAKEINIKEIDVVIVPGLAFDNRRNRLGRGAGFYDRFLKTLLPSTKKVGVAFEFQILDNLPVDSPFDEKVDVVISENFLI